MPRIIHATVLLAEPEPDLLSRMTRKLTQAHYAVLPVASGLAAMDMADKHNPDIAVLSDFLTEADGFQVAAWLKGHRDHRHMKVAVVTEAPNLEANRDRAMAAQVDRLLAKPHAIQNVLDLISELLEPNSAPSAA